MQKLAAWWFLSISRVREMHANPILHKSQRVLLTPKQKKTASLSESGVLIQAADIGPRANCQLARLAWHHRCRLASCHPLTDGMTHKGALTCWLEPTSPTTTGIALFIKAMRRTAFLQNNRHAVVNSGKRIYWARFDYHGAGVLRFACFWICPFRPKPSDSMIWPFGGREIVMAFFLSDRLP